MKNNITLVPIKEHLHYDLLDNGDLILNRDKSSFFLVIATEDSIRVSSNICLNSEKYLQFLKTLDSSSKEFYDVAIKKFMEDI